jgi:hypothetical protein
LFIVAFLSGSQKEAEEIFCFSYFDIYLMMTQLLFYDQNPVSMKSAVSPCLKRKYFDNRKLQNKVVKMVRVYKATNISIDVCLIVHFK